MIANLSRPPGADMIVFRAMHWAAQAVKSLVAEVALSLAALQPWRRGVRISA